MFISAYLKILFHIVDLMKKYIDDVTILSGLALIVYPIFCRSVTTGLYAV